jgi:hypothetical protein
MQLRSIHESKLAIGLPIPHLDNLRVKLRNFKIAAMGQERALGLVVRSPFSLNVFTERPN